MDGEGDVMSFGVIEVRNVREELLLRRYVCLCVFCSSFAYVGCVWIEKTAVINEKCNHNQLRCCSM